MTSVDVRGARIEDAPGMAAVHVQSWRETYQGLISQELLDAPDLAQRRESLWIKAISDGAEGTGSIAVAVHAHKIIGIASAGRPRDDDATWPIELFVLYVLAAFHGTGTGARLLHRVIDDSAAALWVADPNPRAQAFYRKHGFRSDGATKKADITEIRMVRGAARQAEPRDLRC